jgi:hypothetical protein
MGSNGQPSQEVEVTLKSYGISSLGPPTTEEPAWHPRSTLVEELKRKKEPLDGGAGTQLYNTFDVDEAGGCTGVEPHSVKAPGFQSSPYLGSRAERKRMNGFNP